MTLRSHFITAASCLITGAAIGAGAVYMMKDDNKKEPAVKVSVAKPSKNYRAAAGKTFETVVTATPQDNVLHIRAHTWVAQFAMASVCLKGKVAEPKPCHYEAVVTDASGKELTVFKQGQPVTLRELSAASGTIAPHDVTVDIPEIRPRQDIVEGPLPAKVVKLVDGDTVQVMAETFLGNYVLTDIRIGDIDTPEKKGRAKCASEAALAEKASDETRRLIEGKPVQLYRVKFEKYGGRVLGDIRTETGVSAAQNLIDKNLAKPYGGGTKESWCALKK